MYFEKIARSARFTLGCVTLVALGTGGCLAWVPGQTHGPDQPPAIGFVTAVARHELSSEVKILMHFIFKALPETGSQIGFQWRARDFYFVYGWGNYRRDSVGPEIALLSRSLNGCARPRFFARYHSVSFQESSPQTPRVRGPRSAKASGAATPSP